MWAEEDHPAKLLKTKVNGIMVSDFTEVHGGYLALSSEKYTLWTNNSQEFMQQ